MKQLDKNSSYFCIENDIYKFYPNINKLYSKLRQRYIKIHLRNGYLRFYDIITKRIKTYHRYMYSIYLNRDINYDEFVDHIDNNKSNNNLNNLRICTRQENNLNRIFRSRSGYKNIYKISNKYYVMIIRNKQRIFYNSYNTLEEAKFARAEWFYNNHNQFHNLNSILKI